MIKLINNLYTIEFLLERIKNYIKNDCEIIVCTTNNKEDDELINLVEKLKIKYFRGSENDKLQRWYDVAKHFNINNIVTVDGDDLFLNHLLLRKHFFKLKIMI